MINKQVYEIFAQATPFLMIWLTVFFILTLARILKSKITHDGTATYSPILSELPGLPLTLLHTVAFVKAMMLQDWVSALLFIWWGPGFILTAAVVIYCKVTNTAFNWAPFGRITSYLCKVNYVLFMLVYYYLDMPLLMFIFSVWIVTDQINLAWFSNNADRTRRTFEDYWILRLLYIGLLSVPMLWPETPYRIWLITLGLAVFSLWLAAIHKVYRSGLFLQRPQGSSFLRNIVYLSYKQ